MISSWFLFFSYHKMHGPINIGSSKIHHHHHHHISVMELGHLLTRSGLTYPEVSSRVYHDSFCQLGNSASFFFLRRSGPTRALASSFTRFLDHTKRRTTLGRTPLDEWSARRRDLYQTTHNTHNRHPSIHAPGGIRTYNLSRRATVDLHLRPRSDWERQ